MDARPFQRCPAPPGSFSCDGELPGLTAAAMRSSQSRGRRYDEPEHPYRTAYQRDRDRIVTGAGFRRLLFKTQVFVGQPEDHQRNRLTHTLEVSQVARTMARVLKLNEDLAEAIALAHDLGHPPFGHAGERALHTLLADHGGFEHNRQSLRVVELLEHPYTQWPGLNLTFEVLESLAFRCRRHPAPAEFRIHRLPLAEAQVVDQADSIAYYAHDVDDALRGGFVTLSDLDEVPLWREVEQAARTNGPPGMKPKETARAALRCLVDIQVTSILQTSRQLLEHYESAEAVQQAEHPVIRPADEMTPKQRELGQFMMQRVYRHPQVLAATDHARHCLESVFKHFADNPEQMPDSYRRRLPDDPVVRVVGDYIAGMTERYLLRLYSLLGG